MLSLLIWKWRDEAALLDHFELTNLSIYLQKRVARPPCALGIGGWATGWQLWPREEQETSQPSRTLLRARHLTCLISLHTNTPRGTCNSCPPFTVGTLKPKVVNSLPKITQFLRSEAREDQPHPECSAGAGGRVGSERDPYRDKQGNRVRGKRVYDKLHVSQSSLWHAAARELHGTPSRDIIHTQGHVVGALCRYPTWRPRTLVQ